MEVTSYLLEEEEELEACLAAIEPEEMECHDLLVQIFSVSMKKKEFVHVTGLIRKKFPRAKVIGGKVAACISGGRGMDSGISLTFMRFMSSEVHLFGLRLDDNERAIGKDICMDWLEKRKDLAALEVLTIGHINTLSSLFSGKIWVPLFGGLLGDSTGGKEGFIYCDGEILKHGLLLVALCGQHLQVHVERSSGWLPLGPLMTITKVNGPYIVSELDGQPFEHIYSHYIGDLEGETFLDKSLLFPIVLHRESGLIARHPLLCHDFVNPLKGCCFAGIDTYRILTKVFLKSSFIGSAVMTDSFFIHQIEWRSVFLRKRNGVLACKEKMTVISNTDIIANQFIFS